MKKLFCHLGFHHPVVEGTGQMGDGLFCLSCGQDKYPEVFRGIALKVREATKENWKLINNMRNKANG